MRNGDKPKRMTEVTLFGDKPRRAIDDEGNMYILKRGEWQIKKKTDFEIAYEELDKEFPGAGERR